MTDKLNCMLCGSISFQRKGKIRTNRKILATKVLECSHCGLVFLNDDTHISEHHYEQSLMHDTVLDLAESRLETKVDDLRRLSMLESEIKDKNLVEIGSGNGGFLTLAKHLAKSAVGVEPEKKHHDNFNSENLKVYSSINEYANSINNSIEHRVDVVASFHVIEHVKKPLDFLLQMLSLLKPNGKAFVETPNSNDALINLYDSSAFQDFTYWDNHLVLFNKESIEHMVKKISGVTFRSIPVQRYGIANHLYWLANEKPGGHKKWNFLDNTLMNKQYQELLADQNMNDTLFYEFTKISSECKVVQ